MMLRMREPPAVIRDQQRGMHDQAHGMVDPSGLAQGAVPAFVRDFPETCEDEPLAERVDCPCNDA